jgi:hypothetical protein
MPKKLAQLAAFIFVALVTMGSSCKKKDPPQTVTSVTLTADKAGNGTGTVTSSPSGIDCGSDCSEAYSSGTSVTLTATPGASSVFSGWTTVCTGTGTCVTTMDASKTVTASFGQTATLTVAKIIHPSGGADCQVTSSPAGIDCGADCSEPYAVGASVTVTREGFCDSFFNGWTGCDSTSGTSCTVTITTNTTVTLTEGSPS